MCVCVRALAQTAFRGACVMCEQGSHAPADRSSTQLLQPHDGGQTGERGTLLLVHGRKNAVVRGKKRIVLALTVIKVFESRMRQTQPTPHVKRGDGDRQDNRGRAGGGGERRQKRASMQTLRNNRDRASFLLFHRIPHSPTVLILSLSQSTSASQTPSSDSPIRAVSYLSGDNAKTIHAGQFSPYAQIHHH